MYNVESSDLMIIAWQNLLKVSGSPRYLQNYSLLVVYITPTFMYTVAGCACYNFSKLCLTLCD